jgi:hypothetical protein
MKKEEIKNEIMQLINKISDYKTLKLILVFIKGKI